MKALDRKVLRDLRLLWSQAITIAGDEYHSRIVAFFDANLANAGPPPSGTATHTPI